MRLALRASSTDNVPLYLGFGRDMSSAMAILSDKTKKKVRPESKRINIGLFVLDMAFPRAK